MLVENHKFLVPDDIQPRVEGDCWNFAMFLTSQQEWWIKNKWFKAFDV